MKKREKAIKIKTNVKAGGIGMNHDERQNSVANGAGLKVRTNVRAGGS